MEREGKGETDGHFEVCVGLGCFGIGREGFDGGVVSLRSRLR